MSTRTPEEREQFMRQLARRKSRDLAKTVLDFKDLAEMFEGQCKQDAQRQTAEIDKLKGEFRTLRDQIENLRGENDRLRAAIVRLVLNQSP